MNRNAHPELRQRDPSPISGGATGRGVTAVLGPTNTGKTHLAIERMLAQPSGMIGLPLRLLAREVYGRVVERVGAPHVALITGEEKIIPPGARFSICTVEAMPERANVHFLAIDEVQLAADLDRGHTFTDRLLHLRGSHETMLLGAATLRPALEALLPGLNVVTRPRMSQLTYAGSKKITRLPRRSAIVAFSADEVYAIAELVRRQRGAAAVVLGSLSPRTRNAQVELYQSGDVDYLVATDAIGMGLNLDVDHIAFAQEQKFDGHQVRRLTPAEMAQIAGRAGRHTRDGTFGVTGQVQPFEDELVERLEGHNFQPLKAVQWRNRKLDFSSLEALNAALDEAPNHPALVRAPTATDQRALLAMAGNREIAGRLRNETDIRLLWQVAMVPDYRKIAPANHADLLGSIFLDISDTGTIDTNWFAEQVRLTDNMSGDIDALSNRIAHIRTWTYISHRAEWLDDAAHWQERTRDIENRLSDALHERLTKRFVDRRTSVLMKRLRENTMLEAEISPDGTVSVEGHHVGELTGFRFTPDKGAEGSDAKAARNAAQKALAHEIELRATRLGAAANADIALDSDASIRWLGAPVGRVAGGETALKPRIILLADEQLTGTARDKVAHRLERWLAHQIETLLKPLVDLATAEGLDGMARGIGFQLVERQGMIDRRDIADDLRSLEQNARGQLRRNGVRFGAYHVFCPALLKPAPAALNTLLWALFNDRMEAAGRAEIVAALASGRTSFAVTDGFEPRFYELAGYRVLGEKAVRIDILERLADAIRPAMNWRFDAAAPKPRPEGAWDGSGFLVTPPMLSVLGATRSDIAAILKGLGYRNESLLASDAEARIAQWTGDSKTPDIPQPEKPSGGEKGDTATADQEDNQADGQATELQSAATGEVGEEEASARIDIWRPARSERAPRQREARKPRQQRPEGQPRREGKGGKPSKKPGGERKPQHQAGAKPRKEREPDPDSPFAKLAALKEDLQKKDG